MSDDPHAAALALAREVAGTSPDAVRAATRLLNEAVTASLADGLLLQAPMQRSVLGRPNQLEALQANLEKRSPRFVDPA